MTICNSFLAKLLKNQLFILDLTKTIRLPALRQIFNNLYLIGSNSCLLPRQRQWKIHAVTTSEPWKY